MFSSLLSFGCVIEITSMAVGLVQSLSVCVPAQIYRGRPQRIVFTEFLIDVTKVAG